MDMGSKRGVLLNGALVAPSLPGEAIPSWDVLWAESWFRVVPFPDSITSLGAEFCIQTMTSASSHTRKA